MNRVRISKMLRYYSTQSRGNMTSLKEHVERMKGDQKEIYCICGENLADLNKSPLVKTMKENLYEVRYMMDHVDENATR